MELIKAWWMQLVCSALALALAWTGLQLVTARQAATTAQQKLATLQAGVNQATAQAQAAQLATVASQVATINQAKDTHEQAHTTRRADQTAAAAERERLHQRATAARGGGAHAGATGPADQCRPERELLATMAQALDQLAAHGERIAERADAHAADALMLQAAWPKAPTPD